jgi:hypothetical protein
MAVLVGLQTKPLNYSQAFIADYTVGITIALSQTVLALNRVDHSPFPSTLLTVDYLRWRPTIHWRLLALVVSSLANYWLTSSSVPFFSSPRTALRRAYPDRSENTSPYCSYMQCAIRLLMIRLFCLYVA